MRKIFFLALLSIFALSLSAFGQDDSVIQESDKYGFFYYLNANNKLTLLERVTPEAKGKQKLLGFGGANVTFEIKGEKSPVRFTTDEGLSFFFRMLPNIDVAGVGTLVKAGLNKNKRIIFSTSIGRDGKMSNSPFEENPTAVPYKIEKFGKESFRVTPVKMLEPGEYCFDGIGTRDNFCFGIDAANASQLSEKNKIVGKYLLEGNNSEFLEFNENGAIRIKAQGKDFSVYYRVQGNKIILVSSNNLIPFGEMRDSVLIDVDGRKWIKQK